MTPDDAREYSESLAQISEGWWRQIGWAFRQRIPRAMGMSPEEWRETYFAHLRIDRDARLGAVRELADEGMSNRAIADVLGVAEGTVRNDRDAQNCAPDLGAEPPIAVPDAQNCAPDDEWSADETELRQTVEEGFAVVASYRMHRRLIAWAQQQDKLVRVDRVGPWGNPFVVDQDGDRQTVIANYLSHYLPHKPSLQARIPELRGKVLACWCAPEPCHGDVLAEIANHD